MIEQRVTLRYDAQQIPAIVQAVQGDTGRDVIFELADYEIPAGATANYYIDKPDDTAIYNSAEVISSTEILAHLTEQALAAPGRNNGQVRILSGGEVITSFDFVLEVEVFRGILRLQSETEVNIFDEALQAAAEDAIDEIQAQTPVVTGMQNSIAPSYSNSQTYNVGDYVMYNAQLYICITDITTAETWTAAHWKAVPLGIDVRNIKHTLYSPSEITWQIGKMINDQGYISDNIYAALSDMVPCQGGDLIIINTPEKDVDDNWFVKWIALYTTTYSENDTFSSRAGLGGLTKFEIPDNITGFRVYFGRTSSSGVLFTESDLDYWKTEYYFKYPSNYLKAIGKLPNGTDFDAVNDNVISTLDAGHTYINGPIDVLSGVFVCTRNMVQTIDNYFKTIKDSYARYWNGSGWSNWVQTNVTANDTVEIVNNAIDSKIKDIDSRVSVHHSGISTLYIRSGYDADNDIVQCVGCPIQDWNYTFNFINVYLIPSNTPKNSTISACTNNTKFKNQIDDVPGFYFRGTNSANIAIGGNHGNPLFTKCNCSHALTESNIGEVWKDEDNNEYTIVQVFDDYLITGSLGADGWMVVRNPTVLTRNNASISITSAEEYQLRPCAINKTWSVLNEQNADVFNGGSGEFIVISEDYDLVNQNMVLQYLQANAGSNDNETAYSDDVPLSYTYAHMSSKYIFVQGGSVSCFIDLHARQNFILNKIFGMLDAYFSGSNYGYVPDSTNASTLTSIANDVYIEYDDTVPYRFFVLGDNGKGYFTNFFTGIPDCMQEARSGLTYAGRYRKDADKFYAYLADNKTVNIGDVMSWGYSRGPIHGYTNGQPIVCYYKVGDRWTITIDCISSYDGYISLPDFLIGCNFDIIKKTNGMNVIGNCISSSGIKIDAASGDYCELITI